MKMLIFLTLFFAPLFGFAQTGSLFSYEGILTDAGGTPINTSQSVTFQILYGGSCVTFEETQSVTPGANGEFSVIIGAGTRTDSTGNTVAKIFGSSGSLTCQGGATQSLSGFAVRQLHVKVGSVDMLPDVVIGNVPFAWNAQKLADKGATDFVQIDGTNNITQANVVSIFARYDTLDDMLNGDFSGTPVTGITNLTNASIAAGAAIDRTKIANGTANQVVINSAAGTLSSEAQLSISRGGTGVSVIPSNGQLLIGNGTGYSPGTITAGTGITVNNGAGAITISATGTGTVSSITAGTGLTGGTITTTGTIGLGPELSAVNSLSTTGVVLRTGTNTYATVSGVTAAELGFLAGTTSNIQTQLNGTLKLSMMPGASCAAGEALTWQSPANTFACYAISLTAGNVTGLTSAIDARIAADATKLPLAGGTMTGNINLANNTLTNVGYVHLQNKSADPSFSAANNGFVWYNSTDKAVKYYDGGNTRSVAGYTGACSDGQVLKWSVATQTWVCSADAGAGGGANATLIQNVAVSATAPTTGQFLQLNGGGNWAPTSMPACTPDQVLTFTALGVVSCNSIAGLTNASIVAGAAIARSKLANGTANQVLVNDATGAMSSEAQLAVTRGGTGQSAYTDGQLLIGNSVGGLLSKSTLTAGSGITIVNGNGSITVSADAVSNILDGSIVNADVNASAAIARSKLAPGNVNRLVINTIGGVMADADPITASRALVSDTNGIPTNSLTTAAELGYLSGVTSSVQTQITDKLSKAGDTMAGSLLMSTQNQIKFGDNTSKYVGFRAPSVVTTNMVYTLPAADGTSGQILRTDGTGNLSWVTDGGPAALDASYAVKGLIQFDTNEATSGVTLTSGVASVKRTTIGAASTILQLDGTGKALVKGLDLKASTNSVTISPNASTNAYTLTLPAVQGSAGTVLSNDGTGVLNWTTPLTSVDSSSIADGSIVNADINASAAIARSKIAGTAANHVLINDASGLMSSQASLGVPLGGTGTTSFTTNGLVMSGVTGSSALAAINCAAVGRVLEWTGTTWGCSADFVTSGTPGSKVNYVLLSGGASASGVTVSAAGSNATVDLNLLAKGSGAVRVGSPLVVDYETVSKTFRTLASVPSGGTAINFATGNLQYTTASCGAMSLTGMMDGATYVLAVKGTTAATCVFTSDGGLTIKLPPDHGATEAGKSTLYTFMVMGTDVYVSWVTGY